METDPQNKLKTIRHVSNIIYIHFLGFVDKIFNVTILKLQQNLERLKRWLGLYQT
ncbi:MAG: hypothetical protein LN575_05115 [Rickettsia endosymbiont of Gnoriste bilineata]|nr:hypothetical protein [Rickettsia endosymbiont of Gnoriste bilineata]